LDGQVARQEDAELAAILDKYVCVRVIQAFGMDLNIFQFDYDLTWAVFFMNADRTIYGRYGSRSDMKEAQREVSLSGFKKAAQAALDVHAGYPGNKKDLAGKTGPKSPWPTPEAIPDNQGKPNMKPMNGTRGGCVHCHQAHDGELWTLRKGRQAIPDRLMFPFPMPDVVGLKLDPAERATVTAVATGSPAAKGGFKAGDQILKLDGQPIVSIADVQWILQTSKDGSTVKADVERGGQKASATLALAAGWRSASDFTWREWTWSIRHRLVGTEPLKSLTAAEKKQMGLKDDALALRVSGFPPDWVKEKNPSAPQALKKDDVIIDADGQRGIATEGQLLAYLMQKKAAGQSVALTVIRGGKPQKTQLSIPQ
jgi:hypothetical protein